MRDEAASELVMLPPAGHLQGCTAAAAARDNIVLRSMVAAEHVLGLAIGKSGWSASKWEKWWFRSAKCT
jgi:hypothetical protein